MPTHTTAGRRTTEQRARWGRLLNAVLPAPSPERLVFVTEVSRGMLPLVEGSLADVGLGPVIQEVPGVTGESRFRVLVAAKDAEVAGEVLAGC
jgi:hypothetical protein